MVRGIRGAIQATRNERGAILEAAGELMAALIESNRIVKENVSAVFFTVTSDLDAAFPAAIRSTLGWEFVPFLCGQEIPVPDAPERILRVLILFHTDADQNEIQHQYLRGAASLRPDLSRPPDQ